MTCNRGKKLTLNSCLTGTPLDPEHVRLAKIKEVVFFLHTFSIVRESC